MGSAVRASLGVHSSPIKPAKPLLRLRISIASVSVAAEIAGDG